MPCRAQGLDELSEFLLFVEVPDHFISWHLGGFQRCGSHTLAFDEPQFSYVSLAVPGGKDATKIEAVEGQTYTIYCTLPGHRAAGMHATITIGAKGGKPEAGTATPTTTLVGGPTSTTAPKGQSEVDSSQQSGTSQTGN